VNDGNPDEVTAPVVLSAIGEVDDLDEEVVQRLEAEKAEAIRNRAPSIDPLGTTGSPWQCQSDGEKFGAGGESDGKCVTFKRRQISGVRTRAIFYQFLPPLFAPL